MKNQLKKLALLFLITLSLQGIFAFGVAKAVNVQDLLYPFKYTNKTNENTKISLVKNLPSGTPQGTILQITKIILSIAGSLAFVSFTVSGIFFLVAQGQDEKLSKAKGMLIWSIVGLAIIAVSFALVTGIANLEFFTGGTTSVPPSGS